MDIRLHANATTTLQWRAYIQASTQLAAQLAVEWGVSETTIRRWWVRDPVQDRPSALSLGPPLGNHPVKVSPPP
ncbi:MAG: hypothetical protein U1F42_03220 [Candidatus Competibacteraceae bacterium]